MQDLTTEICAKAAVLIEYGVNRDAARMIAATNRLDEILYLARRVEDDGAPTEAAARIVAFFETRDRARMFFASMRRLDAMAAEYAVGLRSDIVARAKPAIADVVAGPHSDLAPHGNRHELTYRLVKFFDVGQRIKAGEDVPAADRATWDRFHAFIPRIRAAFRVPDARHPSLLTSDRSRTISRWSVS